MEQSLQKPKEPMSNHECLEAIRPTFDARKIYSTLLIYYLFFSLFFHPYGFFVSGDFAIRIPDLFAFLCVFLGCALLFLRGSFVSQSRVLFPVLPLFTLEVVLPLIGAVAAGGGIGGIANSARMFILWAPMLLYILLYGGHPSSELHKAFRKILAFALSINLIYALVQISAKLNFLPRWVFFKERVQGFAVDDNFHAIISGVRADGFFANSTGLSVLGVCGLVYFLGRHYESKKSKNVVLVAVSCAIIVLTLSRAALASMILILFVYMLFTGLRRAMKFLIQMAIATTIILMLIERYFGLDFLFSRIDIFLTLGASGAFEDHSVQSRIYVSWPTVLQAARNYPFGTLVSPVALTGTIDSGILTYYVQGGWVFVSAFFILLAGLFWSGLQSLFGNRNGAKLSLGLLSIFLAGAMIISIPMRLPFLVTFLLYLIWSSRNIKRPLINT